MGGISTSSLHMEVRTLACYLWFLSCLFKKVPLPPPQLKKTLETVVNRLRGLVTKLLVVSESFDPALTEGSAEDVDVVELAPEASIRVLSLAEAFSFLRPLDTLCYALSDYNGTGGTGRKKDPCILLIKGAEDVEIDPQDESSYEIFDQAICSWESYVFGVISQPKSQGPLTPEIDTSS